MEIIKQYPQFQVEKIRAIMFCSYSAVLISEHAKDTEGLLFVTPSSRSVYYSAFEVSQVISLGQSQSGTHGDSLHI